MLNSDQRRVIGYTRVSTEEQALGGYGLGAQEEAIRATCQAKGWDLVTILSDEGISGKEATTRPALLQALAFVSLGQRAAAGQLRLGKDADHHPNGLPYRSGRDLEDSVRRVGHALGKARLAEMGSDTVMVARMDRLGRSVQDLSALLDMAASGKFSVYIVDLGIDGGTIYGKLALQMVATFAQWEREQIRDRTRVALHEARRRGKRLGRPRQISAEVVRRIVELSDEGVGLSEIARSLTTDGFATAQGGTWRASTIKKVLARGPA